MPKIALAVVVVVGIAAAGWWLSKSGPRPTAPAPAVSNTQAPNATPGAPKPRLPTPTELVRKPIETDAAKLADVSPECRAFLNGMFQMDLSKFITPGDVMVVGADLQGLQAFSTTFAARKPKNDCKTLPKEHALNRPNQELWNACSQMLKVKDPSVPGFMDVAGPCLSRVSELRIEATAHAYKGVPASQITDRGVMSAVLFTTSRDVTDNGVTRFSEFASRMAELDPNSTDAALLKNQGVYLELISREKGKKGEESEAEAKGRLDEALRHLEAVDSTNPRILETKIVLARMGNDADGVMQLAEQAQRNNPTSDVGPFFTSMALYMKGNLAEAKAELERIRAADPNNVRAKLALDGLSKAKPGTAAEDIYLDLNRVVSVENPSLQPPRSPASN